MQTIKFQGSSYRVLMDLMGDDIDEVEVTVQVLDRANCWNTLAVGTYDDSLSLSDETPEGAPVSFHPDLFEQLEAHCEYEIEDERFEREGAEDEDEDDEE